MGLKPKKNLPDSLHPRKREIEEAKRIAEQCDSFAEKSRDKQYYKRLAIYWWRKVLRLRHFYDV